VHRTELNMANMAVVAPETVSTLIVLLSPLVVALLLFVYLQAVQKMKVTEGHTVVPGSLLSPLVFVFPGIFIWDTCALVRAFNVNFCISDDI
jgi:hypothetical protein